jgi:hypothetical protein
MWTTTIDIVQPRPDSDSTGSKMTIDPSLYTQVRDWFPPSGRYAKIFIAAHCCRSEQRHRYDRFRPKLAGGDQAKRPLSVMLGLVKTYLRSPPHRTNQRATCDVVGAQRTRFLSHRTALRCRPHVPWQSRARCIVRVRGCCRRRARYHDSGHV